MTLELTLPRVETLPHNPRLPITIKSQSPAFALLVQVAILFHHTAGCSMRPMHWGEFAMCSVSYASVPYVHDYVVGTVLLNQITNFFSSDFSEKRLFSTMHCY